MFSRINLTTKGLILVLVPVLFELIFVLLLAHSLKTAAQEHDKLELAKSALIKMAQIGRSYAAELFDLELSTLTTQEQLEALQHIETEVQSQRFPQLVYASDSETKAETMALMDEANSFRNDTINFLRYWQQRVRTMPHTEHPGLLVESKVFLKEYMKLREYADDVVRLETRVADSVPQQVRTFNQSLLRLLGFGLLLNIAICIGLAYLFTKEIVRRLEIISDNARSIATGQPLLAPQSGSDEISLLDQSIHRSSEIIQVARKKESTVLDNAATVICTLNQSLRFKSTSKVLEKVWQYSASELKGMSLLSTVTEQTAPSTRAQFAAIKWAGDGQRGQVENVVRCKDGTFKNALWTVRWSESDATFFCVVHDISRLRATQAFRRQFLGMVGHDLRSPLSSIAVSLAGLLSERKGALPEEAQTVLKDMNLRATKVVDLIGEFLDLERLLAGKEQLNEECVSIYDLCKAAMLRAEAVAKAARVDLVRPSGDAAVLGDSEKLTQCIFAILTTLVGLATPNSSINVHLIRSQGDIEIRATCPDLYLQPAEQEQVFNRLGLIEAASGARTSGVSLMLAKEIIEAHAGKFGCSCTNQDGTSLWFALPEFNDGEEDLP